MTRFMNSTVLSTAGVLVAGAVFAFALYSFYPSSDSEAGAVPIIKAESVPIKIEPSQVGGMDIPFRDSTVFDDIMSAEAGSDGRKIENLLDPATSEGETTLSKDAILAEQEDVVGAPVVEDVASATASTTPPQIANITENAAFESPKAAVTDASALAMADDQSDLEPVIGTETAKNILEDETTTAPETTMATAPADVPLKSANGAIIHEPGASPETLAFVRDVLDKKDAEKAMNSPVTNTAQASIEKIAPISETAPQAIEPASGVEGNINGPKTHYVQLASIPDRSRADSEWMKLKASMNAIPGSSTYRVEEANLGEKGIYYRIQAGPYAESQAKSICESIKAQKPGGCLVVR